MPSDSYRDRVVDEVTDKVANRPGVKANEDAIRRKAAEAVDELVDEPVQTFTPLLAENAVLSDLYARKDDPTQGGAAG